MQMGRSAEFLKSIHPYIIESFGKSEALELDNLVKIYSEHFSNLGRVAINPRVVIGSLIIKHKLELSDTETVQTISENPYIQYFLGFLIVKRSIQPIST